MRGAGQDGGAALLGQARGEGGGQEWAGGLVAGLSGGFGPGWCGFSFSISIFLFQTLLKPN